MITVLLVSLAGLAVISGISLVVAWRGAVDGYEDESGFHATTDQSQPRVMAADPTPAGRRGNVARQLPRVAC